MQLTSIRDTYRLGCVEDKRKTQKGTNAMSPQKPMTGREVARTLGLTGTEVTTLIRGLGLEVGWHGRAMMIEQETYERLKAASVAILAARNGRPLIMTPRRKKAAGA